ncbi:MAG: sialate O-acetylesterase, partial [Candidatus Nanoarchaeia archaeon]
IFFVSVPLILHSEEKTEEKLADQIKLHSLFTSNMVIQRDRKIEIFGTASPAGSTLTIEFAEQKETVKVNDNGKWSAAFAPMPAGGPYKINLKGKDSIALENIMIGDVWLCSGQSNMEWSLQKCKIYEQEIANSNNPMLRLFNVPHKGSIIEEEDISPEENSGWQVCNPDSSANFSAVGYFFGKDLQKDLNIPIGLINSAYSGTAAEMWTSIEALRSLPEFETTATAYLESIKRYPLLLREYQKELKAWEALKNNPENFHKDSGNEGEALGWTKNDFNDSSWDIIPLPFHVEEIHNLKNFDGAIWFRKYISLPEALAGKELVLSLGPIADFDETYFNGKKIGQTGIETENFADFPRKYIVPAELVMPGKALIAIRVFNRGGRGGIHGTIDDLYLSEKNGSSKITLGGNWKYKIEKQYEPKKIDLPPKPEEPIAPEKQNSPSVLFNAMIKPLTRFPIKGVIWYQGESNASDAYAYRKLLPAMITDWRKNWQIGDFPFLIVQLANFMREKAQPEESAWAELREAQYLTAIKVPNCGIVCAIDIGEADNIHPQNKQEVGRRLALTALKIVYGKEDIQALSPAYESHIIKDNKVIIKFKDFGTGLIAKNNKPLSGFTIAGEDRKFKNAKAEIISENEVAVWNEEVPEPKAVRYAWANNPQSANLYNKEGLPAFPFRTDDWEGITERK